MRSAAAVLMVAAVTLCPRIVWAQDTPVETRPATPTFWGDTGLWFVPTAETPRSGGATFSVYRSEFDYNQGFTNVSYWPITMSVGIGSRVETFGAVRVVTRIDRDTRPLFYTNPEDGGLLNDYPFVHETWTGNDFGDVFAGAKVNLLSQSRNQPFGLAFRGTIKIPTADESTGAGTGKMDYFTDIVLSRELGRSVELSGYTGLAMRGDPDQLNLSNGIKWGVGAGFGSRGNVRFTAELWGENPFEESVQLVQPQVMRAATDGSSAPVFSQIDSAVNTSLGVTFQGAGMSFGVGMSYRMGLDDRNDVLSQFESNTGDALSLQFRLGFHRGIRTYLARVVPAVASTPTPPPAPPPAPVVVAPAPAPAPPPPVNRPPTLLVACDPCQIEVGRTLALRATGQDPDGDRLAYRWSTPAGTIGDPSSATTNWTAETVPGTLVLTVTADDGRGGVATGRVNVQVVGAAAQALAFDDILFDFDRDTLRPDALAVLQRVTAALRANPGLRIRIEGHASAEGTAEYNLALGERRAQATQAYLVSQGIDRGRLSTLSYGEEQPRFDNTSETNRAMNRRAVFAVQGQ